MVMVFFPVFKSCLIEVYQADKVHSQSVCQIDSWSGNVNKMIGIKYETIVQSFCVGHLEGQTTQGRGQSDYMLKS